jgi:hypothetical protein
VRDYVCIYYKRDPFIIGKQWCTQKRAHQCAKSKLDEQYQRSQQRQPVLFFHTKKMETWEKGTVPVIL